MVIRYYKLHKLKKKTISSTFPNVFADGVPVANRSHPMLHFSFKYNWFPHCIPTDTSSYPYQSYKYPIGFLIISSVSLLISFLSWWVDRKHSLFPCFSWFLWHFVTPKRSFKGAPGGTAPGSRPCWKSTARVFAASWSSSSCWSDDTISYRRIGGLRIARGVGSWCCLKIWIGYWWILNDI